MDYRAAVRERSGVGEYTHQLAAALLRLFPRNGAASPLELTLFSSSWKDRLRTPPELSDAAAIDARVPVSVLNFAWHRLRWPPAEAITGASFDVTHSMHPLLLPSRSAAPVITIHDLDFLAHPERTHAEIRRDYASLVRASARQAARIITISEFTAGQIVQHLGVSRDRIHVCAPGAPDWVPRSELRADGYVLFLGTLEPRKNVGGLLDAYEELAGRAPRPKLPSLVLAGKATPSARAWLERITRPPLNAFVRHVGYVQPAERQTLYSGARLLVQPSFDEGFGMPVLEAMTFGVPVVAANRGALPEVLGDAGLLVDPEQPGEMAAAIERMLDDDEFAAQCAARGVARAREFTWVGTARRAYETYQLACASA